MTAIIRILVYFLSDDCNTTFKYRQKSLLYICCRVILKLLFID
ncbi:hypothetical protein ACINWC141_A0057 [Acinetobacter sp. WC-141]|nr:hypothetical protein ACINWC141_A0057 [Acinetobacter sp. WC-141]